MEQSTERAMNIRAARISNSEKMFNDTLLDSRTCDYCQTSAAISKNDPVVVYRDRTDDEIRDISIVREVNGI